MLLPKWEYDIMEITLGKRLKELREENNLTQKELAEKLSINAVTYLHYEKGQRQPSLELIAEIAVFYGVSVDYLLGIKDY